MSWGRYEYRGKRIRCLFWIAVGLFAIHASSYLLMPVATEFAESRNSNTPLFAIGCIFWSSIVLGYLLIALANTERKNFIRKRLNGDLSMQCHIGAVTFFSNLPATIVDAALFASVVAFAIIYCAGFINRYITYVALAIVSFSLNTHGLFNGRIYKITKYKRLRRVENHE